MSRIIVQVFAVGLCFAIGQALQCYKCSIGFYNLCLTTTTTCDAGQQCFSGVGKAASVFDIKMKGCLPVADCNKTSDVTFPTSISNATLYQLTKTCCSTDLCNSAQGPALSMVLASITALFMAKVVV